MPNLDRDHHDEFLRLFMAHEAGLRGFLRSLLFLNEEVREVLQDTAVVLWRKYEPGMSPDAFGRWAFGVARMETLAFRRDRAHDRHVFGADIHELLEQAAIARAPADDQRRTAMAVYKSLHRIRMGLAECIEKRMAAS